MCAESDEAMETKGQLLRRGPLPTDSPAISVDDAYARLLRAVIRSAWRLLTDAQRAREALEGFDAGIALGSDLDGLEDHAL